MAKRDKQEIPYWQLLLDNFKWQIAAEAEWKINVGLSKLVTTYRDLTDSELNQIRAAADQLGYRLELYPIRTHIAGYGILQDTQLYFRKL